MDGSVMSLVALSALVRAPAIGCVVTHCQTVPTETSSRDVVQLLSHSERLPLWT